ncbi:FeoA domain-containing protein [Desulfovibrio sp. OttesenSCG-928-A18]|nr:FeoA domain-containing protein [Desulfovibrio sp. OttesenSCG-928-A18]
MPSQHSATERRPAEQGRHACASVAGHAGACGSPCLLDMPCGQKLRVEELVGNPAVRSRLYSLGILPGTIMEVCKPCNGNCVCVRVRQSSLVLGESMAEAVHCFPIDEYEHRHRHGHRHAGCCGGAPARPQPEGEEDITGKVSRKS